MSATKAAFSSYLGPYTPGAVLVVGEHGPANPDLAHPGVLLPGLEAGPAHHNVGSERPLVNLGGDMARQP